LGVAMRFAVGATTIFILEKINPEFT